MVTVVVMEFTADKKLELGSASCQDYTFPLFITLKACITTIMWSLRFDCFAGNLYF